MGAYDKLTDKSGFYQEPRHRCGRATQMIRKATDNSRGIAWATSCRSADHRRKPSRSGPGKEVAKGSPGHRFEPVATNNWPASHAQQVKYGPHLSGHPARWLGDA